jgi:hypothetical protein
MIIEAPPFTWSGNLVLTKTSSGGAVRVFDASTGGAEITFNGVDNVFPSESLPKTLYVEGSGESTTMRDVTFTLAAQQGAGVPDSVSFTVLWVNPIGVASSGSVSADNEARDAYMEATANHSDSLGFQEYVNNVWGWGTEAWGQVHPPSFQGGLSSVLLDRDGEWKVFDGAGDVVSSRDYDSDRSLADNRDDTPDNSSPPGKIYDLDWPGIQVGGPAPQNTILRYRGNFEAYAMIFLNPDDVRASYYFDYYVRFSMKQMDATNGNNWVLVNDVSGDNAVAYGHTNLTWNLE